MGSIENIFTEQNLLNYADACLELAVQLPDSYSKNAFDTLVIPSRGAVPFFLGMVYSLGKFSESELSETHTDFYNRLSVQDDLGRLMASDFKSNHNSKDGCPVSVLLVPFTADLNIEQFDPNESNEEYTKKTRQYWAKFTASLFIPSDKRTNNPYFSSFTNVVLRKVEKRPELAEYYENFPEIKRFAIIDTVISGRASTDILSSFDSISEEVGNPDIQPSSFLIIDENGAKLKRLFSQYLNRKKMAGKVSTIKTARIVSEDEGSSLLGVLATVYPSIMKASKNLEIYGDEFFVGAGSWRLSTDTTLEKEHRNNFDRFMQLVYRTIDARFNFLYSSEKGFSDIYEKFSETRKDFVLHGVKNNILDKDMLDEEAVRMRYRDIQVINPYQTSSGVLHMPFTPEYTRQIFNELKSLNGVMSKHGSGPYKSINP